MFLNAVPSGWESKAYPSLKPLLAWNAELLERLEFISNWVADGKPGVFWISGFYFPQAFLTGTLQNFARKHQLPVDTISFDFKVRTETAADLFDKPPADGVYIRGLFLEGARWNMDKMSLDDSRPKQLYTEVPVLHMDPVEHRQPTKGGVYRCPVYKELSRKGTLSTTGHSTNFVMWIELPSDREDFVNNSGCSDQAVWVKAGVAAVCSLKY